MEAYGLEPQVVLTTPLLLSWDGEKMSSSVGNNIPLTAPPEEQFGRTMRIPDYAARRVVPARARARRAGGGADGGEARARARDRGALARGGGRRARPRRTSRASSAKGRRPTRSPRRALPEGDPVHLPAAAGRRVRALDERGAPADRPGRRQAGRRRRHRARSFRAAAASTRRSRRASGASRGCARPGLTARSRFATVPRPPERVGVAKSPSSTNRSVSKPRSDTISTTSFGGLWRESEAFLRRHLNVALVFENSTACVYVETSSSRGLRPVESYEALTSSSPLLLRQQWRKTL